MRLEIDVDDELMAFVAKEFGAATAEETVNAALAFVLDRRRRDSAGREHQE